MCFFADCCSILKIPTEELQHRFDMELPESVKQLFKYARNFLEFCSYQALYKVSRNPDYLSDPEFRRLTYEMMLAWEAPCVECERGIQVRVAMELFVRHVIANILITNFNYEVFFGGFEGGGGLTMLSELFFCCRKLHPATRRK